MFWNDKGKNAQSKKINGTEIPIFAFSYWSAGANTVSEFCHENHCSKLNYEPFSEEERGGENRKSTY